jgi:hypothetical protein
MYSRRINLNNENFYNNIDKSSNFVNLQNNENNIEDNITKPKNDISFLENELSNKKIISSEKEKENSDSDERHFLLSTGKVVSINNSDSTSSNKIFIDTKSKKIKNNENKIRDIILLKMPRNFVKRNKKYYNNNNKDKTIEIKSYNDYGLIENKKILNTPINKYLPYYKINDENYKAKIFQFYKNDSFSHSRSLNSKFYDYNNNIGTFFNNNDILNPNFNKNFDSKKKRKLISNRKIYKGYKPFYFTKICDGENIEIYKNPIYFPYYYDNDIGFDLNWQKEITETELDDDVETDDEVIYYSEKKIRRDLKEGIEKYKENYLCLKNIQRYEAKIIFK